MPSSPAAAFLLGALLLASLTLLSPQLLLAEAQEAVEDYGYWTLVNPTGLNLSATVDGVETVVKPGANRIPGGAEVCILSKTVYTGPQERIVFKGWLVNGELVEGECIALGSGVAELVYGREFLITVTSSPPVFEARVWGRAGSEVALEVPLEVAGDDARYRLVRVNGPGVLEGSVLRIPASAPVNVTLIYLAELRVKILLSPYGLEDLEYWLPAERETIIQVPATLEPSEGVRLVLSRVEAVNALARILGEGLIAVTPKTPGVVIIPHYSTLYMVKYVTVEGERVLWVPEGQEVTVSAPSLIEVVPGEVRLYFVGWTGDLESKSPSLRFIVTRPVTLEAVYKTAYKVTLESVLGSKDYWVDEGGTLVIHQPPELPGLVLGRRLSAYLVNGEPREPGPSGILVLTGVTSPIQVVAVYEPVVLWGNVAILAGLVVSAVVIYIVYDFIMTRRLERASEKAKEGEERASAAGSGG